MPARSAKALYNVSEELNSVETYKFLSSLSLRESVSEELNSVETRLLLTKMRGSMLSFRRT